MRNIKDLLRREKPVSLEDKVQTLDSFLKRAGFWDLQNPIAQYMLLPLGYISYGIYKVRRKLDGLYRKI